MLKTEIVQTYLCCPACGGALNQAKCSSCQHNFPERKGILDLRWPLAKKSLPEDDKLVSQLLEHFSKANFSQLMQLRFQQNSAPPEFIDLYKDYQSTLLTRGRLMITMFQKRLENRFKIEGDFLALDLGCGVGASSAILAKQFQWVIAIDPSMADLLLAKKYFKEQNINNVILIQATAQHLPIQTNSISFAVALNVIEHLFNVGAAFTEINRGLKIDGIFCGDSRNRFDPVFPEPHAQLRWVGFWPRRLQPWYVKKFKNVPYTSAYLLSWFELRRYAKKSFGNSHAIVMPLVSAYGQSSRIDKFVIAIEKLPIIRTIITFLFPSHLLLAQKSVKSKNRVIAKENHYQNTTH